MYLESAGYKTECAADGRDAWDVLTRDPYRYSAVLLDIMMPVMNGLELLSKLKAHEQLDRVPVIVQTARAEAQDVRSTLEAGAHYYLTKPIDKSTLVAVVKTAVNEYASHRRLIDELEEHAAALALMEVGLFRVRTLEEASRLAMLLARECPESERVVVGLSELLINAIEHGNLGITYDEKSLLTDRMEWEEEVKRRLGLPENRDKHASVSFERSREAIRFVIRDAGAGFDWSPYMEVHMDRLFDSHGRGILLAKTTSFDALEYLGTGSEVVATVLLADSEASRWTATAQHVARES